MKRTVAFGTALTLLTLGVACSDADGDGSGPLSAGGAGGVGGDGASSTSGGTTSGGQGQTGGSDPGEGGGTPGQGGAGGGTGGAGGGSQEDLVCARWQQDRASLSEGTWSGSVAGCNAGDISAEGRTNALKLINLYRFVANLPPVAHDATRNQQAQACALMMHANNSLSHSPPTNWTCYSQAGAQGAANSNIASTRGVSAVDLYMADPGNETTLGHRRWILSGALGPVGLGSTSNASCMWVLGGSGGQSPPFTAWPAPGKFPSGALRASYAPLDSTGWSIQSSSINLAGAQVSVTDGGMNRPMAVTQLAANFGSSSAIRMVPQGWTTQVGHTYEVRVTGINSPISYAVEITDCP
ncbi:uncharacterized protein CMC5_018310 [Chondromyces crocatus]|uniref:SCP domain-containing protein n=2 Tax=Chondromyces crocatus TaxID=52 RepID=A0A0K1EA18_CHOCO|nr:uncharacterized protein CMC5_018310 [Chondromyces crocatus]